MSRGRELGCFLARFGMKDQFQHDELSGATRAQAHRIWMSPLAASRRAAVGTKLEKFSCFRAALSFKIERTPSPKILPETANQCHLIYRYEEICKERSRIVSTILCLKCHNMKYKRKSML